MSGQTMMTCDVCGKEAPYLEARGTGRYSQEKQKIDNGWWMIRSDTQHSRSILYGKTEFDACSWVCAKQMHAKLAEITFDRKTAEHEAACLQWALDQMGIKQSEFDAKTAETNRLAAQIRTLESQLQMARGHKCDDIAAENNRLIQLNYQLESELKEVRKLDREELAFMLRAAIRPTQRMRRRLAKRRQL